MKAKKQEIVKKLSIEKEYEKHGFTKYFNPNPYNNFELICNQLNPLTFIVLFLEIYLLKNSSYTKKVLVEFFNAGELSRLKKLKKEENLIGHYLLVG